LHIASRREPGIPLRVGAGDGVRRSAIAIAATPYNRVVFGGVLGVLCRISDDRRQHATREGGAQGGARPPGNIPNVVALAAVGATAATLGRVGLAKLSRMIVRPKFLSEQAKLNVDALKQGFEEKRR
jgi:hypothetical protein